MSEPANKPLGLVHGGDLTALVKDAAYPLHLGSKTRAAAVVSEFLGQPTAIKNDEHALLVLTPFLQYLLDGNRYGDAAALLWTPNLFSSEPRAVRMLWEEIFTNALIATPGAASMGKSYNIGVWAYLDWRRDPYFTNIQVVGPSEGHLERNLFSHLAKLHRQSAIPGPGEVVQLGITLDTVERRNGIFGLVAPTGKKAAGRLQGVKVEPRPQPHPQFGPLSRLRVILEEAENIPVGVFEDLTNIVSNVRGVDTFKALAAYNPKDQGHPVARLVEPLDGISSVDIEVDEVWTSKRGWRVVRLDAYKSENVVQDREVFFGLQTKKGLETLITTSGGVGTPGYYTMARGWYPPTGVDLAVIPANLMDKVYGEYHFVGTPEPCAALDVALEGGDNAIYILGRRGRASGWYKDGDKKQFQQFKDEFGQPATRDVLQVDQVFQLPKGDTVKLKAETIRVSRGAGVRGNLLGVDRTGNGAGVHDLLVAEFSAAVKGINPSHAPTERRILQEDQQLPCDEYAYLLSELWFATRKFIEFDFLKLSPNIPREPIVQELTGRRFLLTQKKTKVESKKDYKSRGNRSPDRADALTMLVHVVRLSSEGPVSATGSSRSDEDTGREYTHRVGVTDRQDYL